MKEAIELCKRCTSLWGMMWPDNSFLIHLGECSECGDYLTVARPEVTVFSETEKTDIFKRR
jgi:hypothetical protein